MSPKNESPEFTVIIPTFNRAQFVGEAIRSALEQTLPPAEIIVIDDGSSDKTEEVVRGIEGPIRYIRQNNAGPSAARNCGILACDTDWVAFLDSDDLWLPAYLEKQAFEIRKHPTAVAYLANAILVRSGGAFQDLYQTFGLLPLFGDEPDMLFPRPLRAILKHTLTFVQTMVVRPSMLIECGLFPYDVFVGEDLHLMARMALLGPFNLLQEPLVQIIRRQEDMPNLTALRQLRGIETQTKYCQTHEAIMALPGLNRAEMREAGIHLSTALRALGNLYMRIGDAPAARHCFRRAISAAPSLKTLAKFAISHAPQSIWHRLNRKGREVIP
jgi:hypothetical protein